MNKFERRSRSAYNEKAYDYDNTNDGRFTLKFNLALVNLIPAFDGCALLDIACGNGRLLKSLSEKAAINGAGVDISEKMIEQAKLLNPMMEFHVGACDKLPFAESYCDIATVCTAFHHFPNAFLFAKEAKRVIKQGGELYIAEIYLPALLRYVCNPFVKFSKSGDVKFYSPNEIVKLFEDNGFCKKDIVIQGNMQIIVLKKL